MIQAVSCKLFPVGSDGSATVTSTSADWEGRVEGRIVGVAVDLANQPNTVDVTIKHPNASGANILALANMAADVFHVPGKYSVDAAGAALSSDVTPQKFVAFGYPEVVVAQGDAGATKYVEVTIFFER